MKRLLLLLLLLPLGCRAPLPPPKVCEAPPPEAKTPEIGVCSVEPDAGPSDVSRD